jgi:AcrR family transcriptional regulator
MTTRPYVSPIRDAVAAKKRERVIAAAGRLLAESADAGPFSLEAVAKAAGVTRLTVYNQFGSRRGLLEAVFDERARLGGLVQIPQALAIADPSAGLDRVIDIFCEFWGDDPAVGRLHGAAAADPEFAEAVAERHERRRKVIASLVARILRDQPLSARSRRDVVDMIFVLTAYPTFAALADDRSRDSVAALLKSACAGVLERAKEQG